jgi:hypothetical protein
MAVRDGSEICRCDIFNVAQYGCTPCRADIRIFPQIDQAHFIFMKQITRNTVFESDLLNGKATQTSAGIYSKKLSTTEKVYHSDG